MNNTPNFPLRDDKGKIRPVTMTELQQSVHYGVFRGDESIRRVIRDAHSTDTDGIVSGEKPMPLTVVIVRDEDYNAVIYASWDDVNADVIYYEG